MLSRRPFDGQSPSSLVRLGTIVSSDPFLLPCPLGFLQAQAASDTLPLIDVHTYCTAGNLVQEKTRAQSHP